VGVAWRAVPVFFSFSAAVGVCAVGGPLRF